MCGSAATVEHCLPVANAVGGNHVTDTSGTDLDDGGLDARPRRPIRRGQICARHRRGEASSDVRDAESRNGERLAPRDRYSNDGYDVSSRLDIRHYALRVVDDVIDRVVGMVKHFATSLDDRLDHAGRTPTQARRVNPVERVPAHVVIGLTSCAYSGILREELACRWLVVTSTQVREPRF
jgi:hypothetical protein